MFTLYPVVDPDLQIRRGGGEGAGHPDPEMRRGAALKIFFRPSGLSLVKK